MIAELLFVFLIPLVWGFFELRQLRKPPPPPRPPFPPPPPPPESAPADTIHRADDTNQPPSTHQHE